MKQDDAFVEELNSLDFNRLFGEHRRESAKKLSSDSPRGALIPFLEDTNANDLVKLEHALVVELMKNFDATLTGNGKNSYHFFEEEWDRQCADRFAQLAVMILSSSTEKVERVSKSTTIVSSAFHICAGCWGSDT